MSLCTIINAHITDQVIQLSNLPRIASGSKEALQIRCDFCGKWEGCGKMAVFYRDESEVYHVPIVDGLVTVPWEVLADEGHFWLGFVGQDDLTRTTEAIRVEVVKGALTVATATPQDPTPDIYQQLLAAQGKLETRFNAAIAVPGSFDPSAVFEAESADGHVNVTIRSNGFAAHATINVSGMAEVLSPTGTKSYNTGILIPKSYVAIHPTLATCTSAVYGSVDDLVVHMSGPIGYKDDPGAGRVDITLNASATSVPNFASYSVTYVLANPSLPELTAIRAIHPDGLLYDTADVAIRTELDNVDRRVESNTRELATVYQTVGDLSQSMESFGETADAAIADFNARITELEENGGGGGGGLPDASGAVADNCALVARGGKWVLSEVPIVTKADTFSLQTQVNNMSDQIADLESAAGDIDAALDGIIALQEALITGSTELPLAEEEGF